MCVGPSAKMIRVCAPKKKGHEPKTQNSVTTSAFWSGQCSPWHHGRAQSETRSQALESPRSFREGKNGQNRKSTKGLDSGKLYILYIVKFWILDKRYLYVNKSYHIFCANPK